MQISYKHIKTIKSEVNIKILNFISPYCINVIVNISAELISSNYNVFRRDRNFSVANTTRGGGVLLAINKKYGATELKPILYKDISLIDIVGIKMQINYTSIFLFVIYIYIYIHLQSFVINYYSKFLETFEILD